MNRLRRIRPGEHLGEVQVAKIQRSRGRAARPDEVESGGAADRAALRPHVQVDHETVEWTLRLDLEGRLKPDDADHRQHTRNFRQREFLGRRRELQDRLPQILLDDAAGAQVAFGGSEHQILEVQVVVANGDPSLHLIH